MKKYFKIKYILVVVILFLSIGQLFKIDKTNPVVQSSLDFLANETPPAPIAKMIQNQCYDCHSFESKYPNYTNYAPISWWIKSNINGAREYLNFSEWELLSDAEKQEKLAECAEVIHEGEMPVLAYVWMHDEAQFSDEETRALVNWFTSKTKNN